MTQTPQWTGKSEYDSDPSVDGKSELFATYEQAFEHDVQGVRDKK
jgi:hypothetical protein